MNKMNLRNMRELINKASKEDGGVIVGGLNGLTEVRVNIVNSDTKEVIEDFPTYSTRYDKDTGEFCIVACEYESIMYVRDIEDLYDEDVDGSTLVSVELVNKEDDILAIYLVNDAKYDEENDVLTFIVEV